MKITIMTWLYNNNYGSALQAYALQKKLRDCGYECRNVNYKASNYSKVKNLIVSGNSYKLFYEKFQAYVAKKKNPMPQELKIKHKRFNEFLQENCNLTKLYTSPNQLDELNKDTDIFICGSDQIWSPTLFNKIYYFSYVDDNKKKISYAPSFGVSKIEDGKKREKIKGLLTRFDHISIREKHGAQIIKELINQDVAVNLDPTLLLDENEWGDVIEYPEINEPYILCYFLSDKDIYWKKVQEIKEKTGYKVVILPINQNAYNKEGELAISAGPKEYLGLIKNAKFVCTDSFHGCIFSINFKRDFYVFKRFSDDNKKSQNSRIYSILDMLKLTDRLIDENEEIALEKLKIKNYEEIIKNLNYQREKSISWIINAINN